MTGKAAALLAALVFLGGGCRERDAKPVQESWQVMGTVATLSLPAARAGQLPSCVETAKELIGEVNGRMSLFIADSEIARLNNAAGGAAVQVSPLTGACLALALKYAGLSGGAFDVTVGPVVRLWGFSGGAHPTALPTEADILARKAHTGYRLLTVTNGTARLAEAGAVVDLGGVAKGFAVDYCFDRLAPRFPDGLMVDIAGNLRCAGSGRPGRPWSVGVRNPFDRDRIIGKLQLTGGRAVATSGNYEKFVTIDGRRYAHIIDPRTGRPVEGMAGVTVLAPRAGDADALSTACFVLGVDEACRMLDGLPGCSALFVPDREPMEIIVTPGFAAAFTPEPEFKDAVRIAGR